MIDGGDSAAVIVLLRHRRSGGGQQQRHPCHRIPLGTNTFFRCHLSTPCSETSDRSGSCTSEGKLRAMRRGSCYGGCNPCKSASGSGASEARPRLARIL